MLAGQISYSFFILRVQELLTAAKAENANEELVLQASKSEPSNRKCHADLSSAEPHGISACPRLIARLRSESEVQKRISATDTQLHTVASWRMVLIP